MGLLFCYVNVFVDILRCQLGQFNLQVPEACLSCCDSPAYGKVYVVFLTAEFLLILDDRWNVLVIRSVDVGFEVVAVEVGDL